MDNMGSPFFSPQKVAIIGASTKPGKPGYSILNNIRDGEFPGAIYPINLKAKEILGLPAYPTVSDAPAVPDLVIVTTPPATIPNIVAECAELGVPAMIIISAGFREVGEAGKKLEDEIMAHKGTMRIAGPNCLGFENPWRKLNATFAVEMSQPGNVGVISQSGAMLTALKGWAQDHGVGFSRVMSLGAMIDFDWKDALLELDSDPKTKSIIIYMESIGDDTESILSILREVSAKKPIIVIKPGKSEEAARAAMSHTGAITGNDAVLDAALARVGVVRVRTIQELFSMTQLAHLNLTGDGLTLVTNGAGPVTLATDVVSETDGHITKLEPGTLTALSEVLPATWSHANPVDIIGDADPDRYRETMKVILQAKETNAVLVTLTPQDMTDPVACAQAVIEACKDTRIPVLTSWMGGGEIIAEARELFEQAGIPTFDMPDLAAQMFGYMVLRRKYQEMLYETPADASREHDTKPKHTIVGRRIRRLQRSDGETVVPEHIAKELLSLYDIPTPRSIVTRTTEEAVHAAHEIHYPVVLKLHSNTITHKSDAGGVKLNLGSDDEVRSAFSAIQQAAGDGFDGVTVQRFHHEEGVELIVGATTDPQFGPVISFGLGGTWVEVMQDVSIGLPPLNRKLARQLMESTKVYRLLRGYRKLPAADIAALESFLVYFSRMVTENPEIKEIEINPLCATSDGLIVLDARIILYPLGVTRVPSAIRGYPTMYDHHARTKQGDLDFQVRPLRPDDEDRMRNFISKLSQESLMSRFHSTVSAEQLQRHEQLAQRCNIDYSRHMALIAVHDDEVLGITRVIKVGDGSSAEFSIAVQDAFQRRGIGKELMDDILAWAEMEDIREITATTSTTNRGMRRLFTKSQFTTWVEDGEVKAVRKYR
jgi:acetyltransferase